MRPRQTSILPASLGVALLVFGGTIIVMVRSRPLDAGIALAGLGAAAALTLALVAMIWARHHAEAALPLRRDRAAPPGAASPPDASPFAGTVVVPLGDGQAAVIFDDPRAAPAPTVAPAAMRREAAHTADAIWDAVDAAVAEAEPPSPGS